MRKTFSTAAFSAHPNPACGFMAGQATDNPLSHDTPGSLRPMPSLLLGPDAPKSAVMRETFARAVSRARQSIHVEGSTQRSGVDLRSFDHSAAPALYTRRPA